MAKYWNEMDKKWQILTSCIFAICTIVRNEIPAIILVQDYLSTVQVENVDTGL